MDGEGKELLQDALMPVGELDPPHFISRRYPEALTGFSHCGSGNMSEPY